VTRSIAPAAIRIRPATQADADAVHRLAIELAEAVGQADQVTATPATWRAALDRADVVCLVAEVAGQVVAYASTMRRLHLWRGGDVLVLDDLYVRVEFRNHGVGRRLMLTVAQLAAVDDLPVSWVVGPDNLDAQRFYDRLGATLRPRVQVRWEPTQYRRRLSPASLRETNA
jgi:ribosomal protein S18 acetylase RimI-like enzyme